jgi:hypothetical protein
LYW